MRVGQRGECDGFWEEQLEIHSYDTDMARSLTVESLLKYFQEAAWNHAEHLGLGYSHLHSRNQVWVLSRMMIVADSYPEWGQRVILRTWPCGSASLFALRDFELLDHNRRRLLGATSSWLILDMQSRRPQRIGPILGSIRVFTEYRAVGTEAPRLAAVEDPSASPQLEVKYSDLDLNDHVNNAAYARWLLDSYPIDYHRSHRVRSITLNFLAELSCRDQATLSAQEVGELRVLHTLKRRSDGAEACRAEIQWEPR